MTKDEARQYLASVIVAFMSDVAVGPLDTLGNMIFVAQALGCYVAFMPNGIPSYAATRGHYQPEGQIVINTDDREDAIRQMAHEIAHHILWWWDWWQIKIPDAAVDALTPADEEIICRATADLVKALPSGLQWNGKLAAPRGTICRIYRRLPCRLACPIPAHEWQEPVRDLNYEEQLWTPAPTKRPAPAVIPART